MKEYVDIPREKPEFASPEELEALKRKPPPALAGKALSDFQRSTKDREQRLAWAAQNKKRDYSNWKDDAYHKQYEGGLKRGQRIKVNYNLGEVLDSISGRIVYVDDATSMFPYVIIKPDRSKYYYHVLTDTHQESELEGDTPQDFYWSMTADKVVPSKSKEPMDAVEYAQELASDDPYWWDKLYPKEGLSFKQFMKLQEVGTSTGDVAAFKRMTIPGQIKRQFPPWGDEDPFFKKKKKKLLG